jgi:hypothetical protein
MIKESFAAIGISARELFKSPGAFGLFTVLYALLLLVSYLFISTGVGTVTQLGLTFGAALVAPLIFLLIQAAAARFATGESSAVQLLVWSLKNFWKVLVVSVPVIGILLLVGFLLGKAQAHLPAPENAPPHPPLLPASPMRANIPPPTSWQEILFASLRLLLFGMIIPLVGIHFWIALARSSFGTALKHTFGIIARALSARSILTYAIGMIFFGLMPYFLIFTRTSVKNGWLELIIFGARLALAFLFTLAGWLITVQALGMIADTREPVSVPADTPPDLVPAA